MGYVRNVGVLGLVAGRRRLENVENPPQRAGQGAAKPSRAKQLLQALADGCERVSNILR